MPPRSLRRSSFAIPATSQPDIAGGSATKVQVSQLVIAILRARTTTSTTTATIVTRMAIGEDHIRNLLTAGTVKCWRQDLWDRWVMARRRSPTQRRRWHSAFPDQLTRLGGIGKKPEVVAT